MIRTVLTFSVVALMAGACWALTGCEQPEPAPPPPAITWWQKTYEPDRELTAAELEQLYALPSVQAEPVDRPPASQAMPEAGHIVPSVPSDETSSTLRDDRDLPSTVRPLTQRQAEQVVNLMESLDRAYRAVWNENAQTNQPLMVANVERLVRRAEELDRWTARNASQLSAPFVQDSDAHLRAVQALSRVPLNWSREQVRPAMAAVTNACNQCHGRYNAAPVTPLQ